MSKVIRGNACSEEGQGYPTRHALAFPSSTGSVSTALMRGGSEQTDRLRLQAWEPYRQRIADFVGEGRGSTR